MKLAGIEIGGTKLQIVLGNENGDIHARQSHIINAREGASVIRKLIEEDLNKFGAIDGIGVGFGGPIDRRTGKIWTSYHVDGWTGFNIKTWLTDVAGCHVAVDNDANVAALAEAIHEPYHVVFYATLGSGVGGGIVVNKRIYHGSVGGELEFGHVRLDQTGRTVQDSCSGWAVNVKVLEAAIDRQSKLHVLAKHYPGAEAKALLPAIEAGDAQSMEIFNRTMIDLSFGLSHVVHLFHPDIIIIGGGLSLIGEMLRSSIEKNLKAFVMDAFQPGPIIRLSKFGPDVVPVGALILAGQDLKM